MIGFICECRAATYCTYPNCNEGVEVGRKDITERLLDYARDYTTTTYHDDLIREAVTEIESLRQQLAAALAAIKVKDEALNKTWLKVIKGFSTTEWEFIVKALAATEPK